MFRTIAALIFASAFFFAPGFSPLVAAAPSPYCQPDQALAFTPGFVALQAKLGPRMGSPLECEHRDSVEPSRVIQQTTTGWNLYYFQQNAFVFSNGYQWWTTTSDHFSYWTSDPTTKKNSDVVQAFTDAECAANPQATGPGLAVYCFTVSADAQLADLARMEQVAQAQAAQAQAAAAQAAQAAQTQALAAASAAQNAYIPAPTGGVVESRINGEFTGWDGETIFVLQNGQIWQQASYDYTYHYAYSPSVLIYPSSGAWRLKVDGLDRTVAVQRLR